MIVSALCFFRGFFFCGLVFCGVAVSLPAAAAETTALQASSELRWYRGNLHTHSHWSDGNDYLEMIAVWYRDHEYDFLVFTDHNVLANTERWMDVKTSKGGIEAYEKLKAKFPQQVQQRATEEGSLEVRLRTFQEVAIQLNDPEKFLLIQGEEISDKFDGLPIHINASNIVHLILPMKGTSVYDTIQNNVRAVLAQRKETGQPMLVHVNHPNFGYAITAEDLMRVRGEQFFEVYNGHPKVSNAGDEHHVGTERVWDIILAHRLTELQMPVMYGLAVDDGHHYHHIHRNKSNPGRGWVMVLAQNLTAESLIDSLEAGRFYASSGVSLRSVQASTEALTVEVEPIDGETYTIDFIGTRQGFDPTSYPVKVYEEKAETSDSLEDNAEKEGKKVKEGREVKEGRGGRERRERKSKTRRATRRYSTDIGETFATVQGHRGSYQFSGDEIYVRARITSSAKHPNGAEEGEVKRAWTQPVSGSTRSARAKRAMAGSPQER